MGRATSRPKHAPDAGFTLVELLIVMVLIGLFAAMTTWGLRQYASSHDVKGTANAVLSALRNAGERAQSEGRTYCVSFDSTTTWSVWRYSCDPADAQAKRVLSNQQVQGSVASLASGSFTAPSGMESGCTASLGCAYFYPRGNSSDGSIQVVRGGTSSYTINIEGLTGRVYMG